MRKDILHLKASENWMNDPNGFIYYKGNYHLFYQYFPYAPRWGTMHWGHAISKDLVNWEHKEIALFPSKYEDQNGCFSGSAVEYDGKMYIFYTGVHYNKLNPDNIHECLDNQFLSSQMMIVSEDGMDFDNFHSKKVIIPPIEDEKIGDKTHTRDPKVWRGTDAWYMVLGTTSAGENGKLLFYKSDDLKHWTLQNSLSGKSECGWMWECPDYFETEGGKVLLISCMGILKDGDLEANQSICSIVNFQEETCNMQIINQCQYFDYGLDLYAPHSTLDELGRRVIIAWLRMPEAVNGKWIGMFCLPRVVEVKNGHIYFHVHPNIRNAFHKKIDDISKADESGYLVRFQLKDGEEANIGGYRVFRDGNKVCTDRKAVFPSQKNARLTFQTPDLKDGCLLEVFVEKNIVEVYVNDGEYVISNAVYDMEQRLTLSNGCKPEIFTINREV